MADSLAAESGSAASPLVSIVTISFNQGEYLERTIRSVLEQDYPRIEYIVADPGSTDGSREILERYRERIAHLLLDPDKGPADGLNRGFAAAGGEIFGYLNADDVLRPGAVRAAVEYLARHPEVDVVSGHAEVIDGGDRVLRRTYSDRMSVRRSLYSAAILIQPSTFFRRRAYAATQGFNVANRVNWDSELFFDMAMAGRRFARSGRIWSGYRLHTGTITQSQRLKSAAETVTGKRYEKVLGRGRNGMDRVLERVYRIWRHVVNPRDTAERILHGPIAGRRL